MDFYSLKKIVKRYFSFISLAVVLLTVMILTFLFIKPKVVEILALNEKIGNNAKLLSKLSKKANALQSIDPKDVKDKFDFLSSAIPAEKDIPGFLLGIAKIANEASVSVGLIDVNPGSLSTTSAKNKSPLDTPMVSKVTVKGSWENIVTFISKAINGRRLLKVEGVDLSGVAAQKANQNVSMTFLISLYTQPLPKTLGSVEEPLAVLSDEEEILLTKLKNYPLYSGIQSQLTDLNNLPSGSNSATISAISSGSVPVGKTDLFSR